MPFTLQGTRKALGFGIERGAVEVVGLEGRGFRGHYQVPLVR